MSQETENNKPANDRIYADYAATTPVLPDVVTAITPCFTELWGNPSSLHNDGQRAKELLDDARARSASVLGCAPDELYYTSCGSEADNWALRGAVSSAKMKKAGRNRIITTKIEHHAVLNTCEALEGEGYPVYYLGVDNKGRVDMDELAAELERNGDKTALVAVMFANNEIGTIQPIADITKLAHKYGAWMFTDAVQAVGSVPVDAHALGVDMLSMSGHKLGAPKGIGALYIRKGILPANLINGGGQERGRRGGTENVPYIVGFAKALEIARDRMDDMERVALIRDRLISELTKIPASRLNGDTDGKNRLPGNVNVSFEYIEGESLMLWLDIMGVSASTGSACSSKSLEPSHVLMATGLPIELAHGSLRLSISHATTDAQADRIIEVVREAVEKLRAMSPLYHG